jgi:Fe2+ or Zn2+ uptake regulation protein
MRIIPENPVRGGRPARAPVAARAAAALRQRGLRLTGPRRLVLEVVQGTDAHPTAEAVHRLVRRQLPRVSLGTVYRNLRLLVAQGLLRELPGPHARFDGNLRDHHHFTCTACGRILDVEGPLSEPHGRALAARVAARTGLTITGHHIAFFGRCPACRPGRPRRPAAGPAARPITPRPAEEERAWPRASRAPRATRT